MIAICVPTLGEVSIQWAASWAYMQIPMNVPTFRIIRIGMPVAEARNSMVKECFEHAASQGGKISHFFWHDDDVIADRWALCQLHQRRVPIVSGVYFDKAEVSEPLVFPAPHEGTSPFVPDQFIPVWGHGMGLTLIEADVYQRMEKELDLGKDSMGNPQWYKTVNREATTAEDGTPGRYSTTEDLYFLTNAAKLGYQPMVDTTQHAFGWHFDRRAKIGYPRKQFDEWETKRTATWDTPGGPVVWKR